MGTTLRTVTVALAAMALPAAATSTAAAETAADGDWTASYGTARAAGTSWTEPGTIFVRPLVIKGELENTGSDCYSAWIEFTQDLTPGLPAKNATQCGPGTTLVDYRLALPSVRTVSIKICRGSTDMADCGPVTWF
ncbi:hypothetical protein KEF29_29855 [Streptomyces tuirus]|uniref:Secreted protein n=1 Tax=Streptomyces tuirus TaxID=68278 RepID=A0A941J7T8_9ACTN|nr:hypothetical protein [Streptomyces tuirus]